MERGNDVTVRVGRSESKRGAYEEGRRGAVRRGAAGSQSDRDFDGE